MLTIFKHNGQKDRKRGGKKIKSQWIFFLQNRKWQNQHFILREKRFEKNYCNQKTIFFLLILYII